MAPAEVAALDPSLCQQPKPYRPSPTAHYECGKKSWRALQCRTPDAAKSIILTRRGAALPSAGETIGKITQVGKTADGTPAVAIDMDGKTVSLAASSLTLSAKGDEAVTSMTKAQIEAAASPAS